MSYLLRLVVPDRPGILGAVATALVLAFTGCGSSGSVATGAAVADANGNTAVVVAANTRTATRTEITVQTQQALRAELPAAVRDRGTLVIGVGALPAGFPPLAYVGDDHTTLTGAEPDLGRLVAATLRRPTTSSRNGWSAIAWAEGQVHRAPVREAVDILDRVGGGDAFVSGLAVALMEGHDLDTALSWGTAHGALAMTTPGDASMASRAEVLALASGSDARTIR